MTMHEKCHNSCCGKGMDKTMPNGCQKDKCVLNISFTNATYLVFNTDYQLQNSLFYQSPKEKSLYHDSLISNYRVAIWQPPEFCNQV
ncbi:hypothetical protein [Flavobacterium silvisoli]|nr:hypothetical protein [Flavobacterium silvisoli]